MADNYLYIYVLYDKPKDHPEDIVVRRWKIGTGTVEPQELIGIEKTLTTARKHVPVGLTNMGRESEDDPCILEVWV